MTDEAATTRHRPRAKPKRNSVPSYVLRNMQVATARQWRALKRQHIQDVVKAMNRLQQGSAFMPGYSLITEVSRILTELRKLTNAKVWK